MPLMNPLGMSPFMSTPNLHPMTQTGRQAAFNSNPLAGLTNPMTIPPVPLMGHLGAGMSGFAGYRNPNLLAGSLHMNDRIGIDINSTMKFNRGAGINSLLTGEYLDADRLKKTLYRNDLLTQMDDNKLRRVERYNANRLSSELEDERLRRENGLLSYWDRDRQVDQHERVSRHQRERMHRIDEDRYKYKSFRKGSEPVEAYWLDDRLGNPSRWNNRRHPYDHWGNDRYPVPPPGGWPERDFWNHGDREAPWRKERGFWQNGKWVPLDVANQLNEKVGKEVEKMRGEMNKNELDLQLKLNSMKKIAADADRERNEVLATISHIKNRMNNQEVDENTGHKYEYHQLMNSMNEKQGIMKKRTELLPEITTFPKLDKVQFRLPERPTEKYDALNKLPKSTKFINEQAKESIDRQNTKVRVFDADYLNQVNSKRLDDLLPIDTKLQKSKDALSEYLDRETAAGQIYLHSEDVRNELMNKDILKDIDRVNDIPYQTPLRVIEKYQDYPSLDQLTIMNSRGNKPFSQKGLIQSHSMQQL
eukprot:403356821